jgi:lysophospholipase L1-like esterase
MRRILVLVTFAALLVGGLAPTAAADIGAPEVDLVALGDSYAAGVGAPPYSPTDPCLRSQASYPELWAAERHPRSFAFVACSGATTTDVLANQVSAVNRRTDLVTITVGGNDVGFTPVLAGCTVADTDVECAKLVAGAEVVARYVLPFRLAKVYLAVRARAPRARVVVLGYPRLFDVTQDCASLPVPNASRRASLNRGADVLDDSIRRTAEALGLHFADVRAAFAGHGVCGQDPWIVVPASPPSPDVYHPTATGYSQGYLPALEAATPELGAAA